MSYVRRVFRPTGLLFAVLCTYISFLVGCEPQSNAKLQLYTHKQDFSSVSQLSFHFSGKGLLETPKPTEVSVAEGSANLPALAIDEKSTEPWFDVRVFGLDDSGKPHAFGALRLPFRSSDFTYDIFFTRMGQFVPLVGSNQAKYTASRGLIGHSIIPLKDGRILIAGGASSVTDKQGILGVTQESAMNTNLLLYTPDSEVLSVGPRLGNPRAFHTASLLPDGRVVLAGGLGFIKQGRSRLVALQSVEIFDPSTDSLVVSKPSLSGARAFHSANVLSDGSILFVGGLSRALEGLSEKDRVGHQITSVERYVPGKSISKVGELSRVDGRFLHQAVGIGGDNLLVVGGMRMDSNGKRVVQDRALILRRSSDTEWNWREVGTSARYDHTLVGLRVENEFFAVALGGRDGKNNTVAGIDVWDATGKKTSGGSLRVPRYGHTSVQMENNSIFVSGGINKEHKVVLEGEVFAFAKKGSSLVLTASSARPKMTEGGGRYKAAAVTAPFDPRVHIVGGGQFSGTNSAELLLKGSGTIELYTPILSVPSSE